MCPTLATAPLALSMVRPGPRHVFRGVRNVGEVDSTIFLALSSVVPLCLLTAQKRHALSTAVCPAVKSGCEA